MIGPTARILLRYVAMLLAAKGYFDDSVATALIEDRDLQQLIEMGLGLVISVLTEIDYKVALKNGWRT